MTTTNNRLFASYEWCLETVEGEDVVDHHHEPRLDDLPEPESDQRIVLVRSWGNDEEGVVDRSYAYPDGPDSLPATFDGGQKIKDNHRRQWAQLGEQFWIPSLKIS
tara:strand:- start:6170 stop:6487 length:318 start_codon:yes stop_codon:yes gene_type:complete